MSYGLIVTLHLLAAIAFVGMVFVEVIMIEGVRRHVPNPVMREFEQALGARAVRIMPWVLLVLYAAGLTLAWHHRATLSQPLASSFGLLLSIKIVLATSVFGHFVTAMLWRRNGILTGRRSRRIHLSIFVHVILIVVLAKSMYYWTF